MHGGAPVVMVGTDPVEVERQGCELVSLFAVRRGLSSAVGSCPAEVGARRGSAAAAPGALLGVSGDACADGGVMPAASR